MGESYRYFGLDPGTPCGGRSLDDALSIIRLVFDDIHEDVDAAVGDAKRRHRALSSLGAPPELVALYSDPKVVRIHAADADAEGYSIEFDLWDEQGIIAYPKPDASRFDICEQLAWKLADVLGYNLSVEEYD